jgi:dGTPase
MIKKNVNKSVTKMSDQFRNPFSENQYKKRLISRREDVRGAFFRDHTAIIHSLPFRRLKHKAQVFFDPNNDHVCTRIEHAFHVASIAATICKGLGLNEQVAYAIGLAHDLGHPPFGHAGESALKEKASSIGGFIHELHGLRVIDILGNRGTSLNLTFIVRDGVICHCGENTDKELDPRKEILDLAKIKDKGNIPCSYEGCATRLSDKIAYLGRDLEDAIYGGFIKRKDIPPKIEKVLGETNGEIIDALVLDVIKTSKRKGTISFSDEKYELIKKLYDFSVEKIYKHKAILRYQDYCTKIVSQLFDYLIEIYDSYGNYYHRYKKSPVPLDRRFGNYLKKMERVYRKKFNAKQIVTDYIAGMTDGYALRCMREISLPEALSFG